MRSLPKAANQGVRALDYPAMSFQPSIALDTPAGNAAWDASLPEVFTAACE
jgi:hypothetical protein